MVPDKLMFTKPQKRRVESMPTVQYNASRGSSNLRVMAKVFVKDNGEVGCRHPFSDNALL